MNLYLINDKIRVVADGIAGAIYLADKEFKIGLNVKIELLKKNFETDFNPRVLKNDL